jgi:aerobic carbon-monoxide dehydrogenase medium subunit
VKPAPFAYHRPDSVAETLDLLAQLDDAKIIAGGQSLMAMMNFRYVTPENLIDINRIAALSEITLDNGNLRIGAMVRQRDAQDSPLLRTQCPLIIEALGMVGHVQTRNRGTIGGSLAHLDPAAELPAVFYAHDAILHVASANGSREVPISEWSQGFMTTDLQPDELLIAVTMPLWPADHGYAFLEMARRHGDFALVGAAALITLDGQGKVARAAIALTGVDMGPVRLNEAEAMLAGHAPSAALIEEAAQHADKVAGIDDVHASRRYRRRLAVVYARRALELACRRAREKELVDG